jgi:hypothetical protein
MSIILPLDQMSTADKLQVMEELRADLTRNEKDFQSPAWHLEALNQREERLQAGLETPIDWDTAKKELRSYLER